MEKTVSNQDAVIVFEVAGWPDVSFIHQRHAEYWNNHYKITFTFN